ncbi:hypothetical protein QJS66_02525 [Kocuria rhizophila]|nr:hypothetical protein QJS66_02525 [Kocuria rhizophila]
MQTWAAVIRSPQDRLHPVQAGDSGGSALATASSRWPTRQGRSEWMTCELISACPSMLSRRPVQPAAECGTLEVLPSTGMVLQRISDLDGAGALLCASLATVPRTRRGQPAGDALTSLADWCRRGGVIGRLRPGGATACSVPAGRRSRPAVVESKASAAMVRHGHRPPQGWSAESGLCRSHQLRRDLASPARRRRGPIRSPGRRSRPSRCLENSTPHGGWLCRGLPDGRPWRCGLWSASATTRARRSPKTMTAHARASVPPSRGLSTPRPHHPRKQPPDQLSVAGTRWPPRSAGTPTSGDCGKAWRTM